MSNRGFLVEYLSDRAGLLLPRGVKVYSFPHRTIQEYLAACYLTDHDYPNEVAALGRTDPDRWREVVLLAGAKSARGSDFALWALVERLCFHDLVPDEALDEPGSWGALLAGQALVESAKLEAISTPDLPKIDRVRTHLVRIIEAGRLPATERVSAGNNLAQLGDPREAVTTMDKMEFCLVPAGPFWMGGEERDAEKPLHLNERLDYDYWMARYPVTVAQFREFVEASEHEPENPESLRGLINHPVVLTSWHEAQAFCEWLTSRWRDSDILAKGWAVRLPSEAEWEKAARGGVDIPRERIVSNIELRACQPQLVKNPLPKREYSWGDDIDLNLMNCHNTRIGSTSAVGCFPGGTSAYGCSDMAGNVWEWTRSPQVKHPLEPNGELPFDPTDGREKAENSDTVVAVVRGGSYRCSWELACCASLGRFHPHLRLGDFGFRVVVSPS